MTDALKTKTAPEGEKALKPLSRAEALARVKADPLWDVVVVGGGATGAGIAVDEASRPCSLMRRTFRPGRPRAQRSSFTAACAT